MNTMLYWQILYYSKICSSHGIWEGRYNKLIFFLAQLFLQLKSSSYVEVISISDISSATVLDSSFGHSHFSVLDTARDVAERFYGAWLVWIIVAGM